MAQKETRVGALKTAKHLNEGLKATVKSWADMAQFV